VDRLLEIFSSYALAPQEASSAAADSKEVSSSPAGVKAPQAEPQEVYACRKCRRVLFSDLDLSAHTPEQLQWGAHSSQVSLLSCGSLTLRQSVWTICVLGTSIGADF